MERRRFPRFLINCSCFAIDSEKPRVAEVKDISMCGALIRYKTAPERVHRGSPVRLCFFDRRSGLMCNVDTAVARMYETGGNIYAGLMFDNFSDDVMQLIGNLSRIR